MSRDRRYRGSGPRNPYVLLFALLAAVILAFGAFMAGRSFVSPEQQAANAAPPSPSLITVPVEFGELAATVVFRADVSEIAPVSVGLPDDLGSSLPVITSLNTRVGAQAKNGEYLLSIAERPIFVFEGNIPAFRDMVPGTTGVDVAELQTGLLALGYSTGSDTSGLYGPGTEAAIHALYVNAGFQPALTSPNAGQTLEHLAAVVSSDQAALTMAQDELSADTRSGAHSKLAADRAAVNVASAQVKSAQSALWSAQETMGAMVPRGEVVFVPHLPEHVISLSAGIGSTAQGTVAQIGSGRVALTGQLPASARQQVYVGIRATATDDVSGMSFKVEVSHIASAPSESADGSGSGYRVVFAPVGKLPSGMLGQNVAVSITTASSRTKVLVVPIAAINTSAAGEAYVTVAGAGERTVRVRLGLSADGQQAVTPVQGSLRRGDRVVIGTSAVGA